MAVQSVTVSDASLGAKSSAPISVDWNQNPFNIGIGCIVTGTVSYTVEHTFDDNSSPTWNPAAATWFPNTGITTKTANQDGNYAFAVSAVRLTLLSGTGSVTMRLLQAVNSP